MRAHCFKTAGSDDGTLDWLPMTRASRPLSKKTPECTMPSIAACAAPGAKSSLPQLRRQYLPGALLAVEKFFLESPRVDVLFADFVVVDAEGDYGFIARFQTPRLHHTWVSHLPAFTCATFFSTAHHR